MNTMLTNVSEEFTLNIYKNPTMKIPKSQGSRGFRYATSTGWSCLSAKHISFPQFSVRPVSAKRMGDTYVLKNKFWGKCINDRKYTVYVSTPLLPTQFAHRKHRVFESSR